jgi:tRNA threonylcarbamoyladenosine biosynthesis protein TsaE
VTVVPLTELPEFVRNVNAAIAVDRHNTKAVVFALRGEVGSGKTTFVQQLVRQMGNTESVVSPTYVLMKKYRLPEGLNPFGLPRRFKTIVHIDAYRMENPTEFKALKPEEFLDDPSCLVVVEWPEKLGKFLPKPDVILEFKNEGTGNERRIDMRH